MWIIHLHHHNWDVFQKIFRQFDMYINNNILSRCKHAIFKKNFCKIGYKTINHFYVLFEVGVGALMFLHDADAWTWFSSFHVGNQAGKQFIKIFWNLLLCILGGNFVLHKQWLEEEEEVRIATFVFMPVLPTLV